ncbi:hypothetical protein [Janthinobacterium sp. Ant5-2-1]|uniref:hypothetical protein n=1 Tax=Janthinobacterium sp. Ant5-2-1 TaxID=1755239 RepID=UPI0007180864|nr:hypothetical protein [Janthinobacterium sp. Ant5-2-1]
MKMKTLKQLAICLALGVTAVPALSIPVFDPTNFVQNYTSAVAAVKQEITAAKQLIQETQSAVNMAKSVKSIANLEGIAQVKEALNLYKQLKAVDSRLENDFQQSADLTERISAKYGASGMSWSDYLNSRSQLDKQQRDTAAQRYRAINASIEQTSQQRQAIVSKLGSVQGQTEAMQTLGASIDVLIGQNQQIISILASTNRANEMKHNDKATDDASRDEEADNQMNSYQQRLRDAAKKY